MKDELKEILEDLKKYFEFQKALGLEGVVIVKENAETVPNLPERKEDVKIEGKLKEPMIEKKEDVIKIQDQLGIFDISSNKKLSLDEIREELGNCTRCKLHEGRTNIVFGEGNPKAKLVFVGEGPGQDEDKQGRPFVGRAGQLLTKIIGAMGLERSDVYIANVVKSRPPGNRVPEPDEIAACSPFLFKQLKAIDPDVIVCLGNTAAQTVLKTKEKLGNLRGKFHHYGRAKVMVTYHPAALLRNPGFKKPLWDDVRIVMKELGISTAGD